MHVLDTAPISINHPNYSGSVFISRKISSLNSKADAHLMHAPFSMIIAYPTPTPPIYRRYRAAGVQSIFQNTGENSTSILPFDFQSIPLVSTRMLFLMFDLTDGRNLGRSTSSSWFTCVVMLCFTRTMQTLFRFRPTIWKSALMSRTDRMMSTCREKSFSFCL